MVRLYIEFIMRTISIQTTYRNTNLVDIQGIDTDLVKNMEGVGNMISKYISRVFRETPIYNFWSLLRSPVE